MRKKAYVEPLECRCEHKMFKAVVVIPVLAEEKTLPMTIEALSRVEGEFAVILVVNNRVGAPAGQKQNNQRVLAALRSGEIDLPWLYWIDRASVGKEIPAKMGVGLVRRIGMDTALTILDADGIICSLDADTLVEPDYIRMAMDSLSQPVGAGYFEFEHQKAENPLIQKAIDAYEEYLHHYVAGLKQAGSPYAYHAIGSTMVATAEAYVLADGVPVKRLAGEDFYFLQNIAKHCRIVEVASRVYPSARLSERTPFGTGQRMMEYERGRSGEHLYCREAFEAVGSFLRLVEENISLADADFIDKLESPFLREYLEENDFKNVWLKLKRNYRLDGDVLRAFHRWFDGLKTLKVVKGVDNEL